jgi:hypothetical protein
MTRVSPRARSSAGRSVVPRGTLGRTEGPACTRGAVAARGPWRRLHAPDHSARSARPARAGQPRRPSPRTAPARAATYGTDPHAAPARRLGSSATRPGGPADPGVDGISVEAVRRCSRPSRCASHRLGRRRFHVEPSPFDADARHGGPPTRASSPGPRRRRRETCTPRIGRRRPHARPRAGQPGWSISLRSDVSPTRWFHVKHDTRSRHGRRRLRCAADSHSCEVLGILRSTAVP